MSSRTDRRSGALLLVAAAVLALSLLTPVRADAAPRQTPDPAATNAVPLTGHGFGHGRGMGQYGAQGYAKDFGWNAQQILDHFYGGTTSQQAIDDNSAITVRLVAQDGRDLRVTSGARFNVPGIPGSVDAGRTVRIHWTGSAFVMAVADQPCAGTEVAGYNPTYPGGQITSTVADPGSDLNQ